MEIVSRRIFGSLSKFAWKPELHFLLISLLTWLSFLMFAQPTPNGTRMIQFMFALGTSAVTLVLLRIFGYFNPFRSIPRKSDLFIVAMALPVAVVATHLMIEFFLDIKILPISLLLLVSPFFSTVIFYAHVAACAVGVKLGKKRLVVLDVSVREKALLLNDFKEMGMDKYLTVLTKQDLKEHLLRADHSSIDLIIISKTAVTQFEEDAVLLRAHLCGIPIVDFRTIITSLTGRINLADSDLWSYVLGATPQTTVLRFFTALKSIVEPVIAIALAILFAPVMLAVALIIKRTSKGPVFYRQVRTGYLGRNFTLVKFRSMFTDAEANGIQWASHNDSRVTPIGKFMRKTRLDELPQLWNVIRGEMGFFGPRPERPEIYRDLKKEIPLFSMRTVVRPGITGWAQVYAGYAASVEQSQKKLEYDLFYIQNMSPRLDLIILFKTILVAVVGEKAPAQAELPSRTDEVKTPEALQKTV